MKESFGYLENSESTEPNDESTKKVHEKPAGKKYDREKRLVKSLGKTNSWFGDKKANSTKTERKINLTKADSEANLTLSRRETNLTISGREANLTIAGHKAGMKRNKMSKRIGKLKTAAKISKASNGLF